MYTLISSNISMHFEEYLTIKDALYAIKFYYLEVYGIKNLENGKLEYIRNWENMQMEKVEA